MKQLGLTALAAAVADVIAYAIVRAVGASNITIAFVVGAMIGSWIGFYLRHRAGDDTFTTATTVRIGGAIAIAAIAVGLAVHAYQPIQYPEVTLPIAAIGSFVFPFIVRKNAANAFASLRRG